MSEHATSPPLWYTLAEVAEITGLSLRALRDGARAGRIPTVKVGGQRRMTPEQFDRLVRHGEEKPDPLAKVRKRLERRGVIKPRSA